MTDTQGPRPGQGTRSTGSNTYDEGTAGLEERDRILAALRANGFTPYTNSNNGYYWFTSCPAGHTGVRISSGKAVELACLGNGIGGADKCAPEDVVRALGLDDLIPTAKSFLEALRAALVDSAGLDDIPDPDPLIGNDILFRDSLAWMVGKPGSMKSFTALDMAGCVATGEVWQGYRVSQGPVLFLVAEGVRGTKKRVRAWEKAMGRPMDGVSFLPIAVQSKSGAQWDAFVQIAAELRPALIVLDTQARITVGVEENSNTEMGEFVAQADRLRVASGACVLIVHHIGRHGDTGRGATTVDGAVSTIIKISKDEDRVKLECQKSKDGVEWDDIELRAVPMAESVVLAVQDPTNRAAGTGVSAAALKMARIWADHHGTNWVPAGSLIEVVAPKTTFYRNLRELEHSKVVEVDTTGRYPRYRLAHVGVDGAL
jgi:hypothetical protein